MADEWRRTSIGELCDSGVSELQTGPFGSQLHAYDYVNRPYEAVRASLLADPLGTFQRATAASTRTEASSAELHAKVGGVEVGMDVTIEIVAIENGRSPDDRPATNLTIEWKATHRPGLFPTMRATLSVYALTPTETQLDFAGTYDPPLGIVGEAVDAIAMHGIAKESVTGFVHEVARFLAANHAA